jgi:hypothetical protein
MSSGLRIGELRERYGSNAPHRRALPYTEEEAQLLGGYRDRLARELEEVEARLRDLRARCGP